MSASYFSSNAPTGKRLRRLNARQRKKLHVGEFQQFIFEVRASFSANDDSDALLDALIEMIESRDLFFGGSVGRGVLDGMVSACAGSPSEDDRQAVLQWLQQRGDVTQVTVGELADAWYGWH
ncbi:YggL family protein [Kerstersia similis]|uniref:YggL 50S ribosome-binding family protein n=1 Tax=Kerstersia similis TaxID=206505 RepID=UPI0039EE647C